MNISGYIIWGLILIIQYAMCTWMSRARNSKSFGYHAMASAIGNGSWFISQLILVDAFVRARASDDVHTLIILGIIHTVCTVIGGVGAHYLLQKYVERDEWRPTG